MLLFPATHCRWWTVRNRVLCPLYGRGHLTPSHAPSRLTLPLVHCCLRPPFGCWDAIGRTAVVRGQVLTIHSPGSDPGLLCCACMAPFSSLSARLQPSSAVLHAPEMAWCCCRAGRLGCRADKNDRQVLICNPCTEVFRYQLPVCVATAGLLGGRWLHRGGA